VGGGGHAKVVLETLSALGANVLGITDPGIAGQTKRVLDVEVLGDDKVIFDHRPGEIVLANGVGFLPRSSLRQKIFETFRAKNYRFATLIHPAAYVAGHAELGDGVQIMAGAIVQPGSAVLANSIINTRASVDHDCKIGESVHIAPGATLCGNVEVGDQAFVGCGASVLQGVSIGREAIVGGGAVVLRDVPAKSTFVTQSAASGGTIEESNSA
jgi:sugar O-acyltransferase (sialic acid O-acetyltransferase NeuD family)